MIYNTFFILIIAIIILDFIFERWLSYLNLSKMGSELPNALKEIYDPSEYERSQKYMKTNAQFSLISESFSFIILLLMLFLGGFGWIDGIARGISENPIINALLFFGIIGVASDILSTPFDWYGTFVIEERFGFNKTTAKTFVSDKIKGWLLGAVIGGALLSLIVFVYTKTGNYFWMVALAIITIFSLFVFMFYTSLILPLFNKQTPLPAGSLRDKISQLGKQTNFKLSDIYVMDGSKRSTKANAFFSGLGSRKRIVLYDTLINDFTEDEVLAVLAHEIGHYKKRHTAVGLLMSFLSTSLMLFVLSKFLGNEQLIKALGGTNVSFHLSLVAFGILFTPVQFGLGIVSNVVSRINEYQADKYAADLKLGTHLIAGLKKLSAKSLSNLTPHPLYVWFNYSHPSLLQRINQIKKSI